ncbi:MAG: pantetheine-phosphate adenylyltransferase [Acholeplasmataceae bacterium]|nr:pantetheine-phosphate adenylyltransferase [Acholeplasmataceae bacterium]
MIRDYGIINTKRGYEIIMRKAVYAGSFDPLSNGHIDIMERAAKLVDKLYVLVTVNIDKHSTFTIEERVNMIKKVVKADNIEVAWTDDLVVKFAEEKGATTLIRGLRNIKDFESEIALYHFNRNIDNKIETIVLFPTYLYTYLSSSAIRELVYYNQDITPYVPNILKDEIIKGIRRSLKKA